MSVAVAAGVGPVPPPILVVEDEPMFARVVERVLTRAGHDVLVAPSASAGIAALARRPRVVLLDWNLPDGFGGRVLDAIEAEPFGAAVVVLTGSVSGDLWLELTPRCQLVLPKPLDIQRLPGVVDGLLSGGRVTVAVRSFAGRFGLSPREEHLVAAAARGRSDKEVLHELGCSRGTVATYWQRVFAKTGQRSQRDVVALILRHATGG